MPKNQVTTVKVYDCKLDFIEHNPAGASQAEKSTFHNLGNALTAIFSPTFNTAPGIASIKKNLQYVKMILTTWEKNGILPESYEVTNIEHKWRKDTKLHFSGRQILDYSDLLQTSYDAWLAMSVMCQPTEIEQTVEEDIFIPSELIPAEVPAESK